jgi:hypothetical protein
MFQTLHLILNKNSNKIHQYLERFISCWFIRMKQKEISGERRKKSETNERREEERETNK